MKVYDANVEYYRVITRSDIIRSFIILQALLFLIFSFILTQPFLNAGLSASEVLIYEVILSILISAFTSVCSLLYSMKNPYHLVNLNVWSKKKALLDAEKNCDI